jgi:TetR/AcrR family transcriptional regulator, regulator of cefoperazone and chloramphenicol sensitivity
MKAIAAIPKSEEMRRKIVEIAGQIFAEVGYEAATVRQITDRAQVNVAAVNYYFGDKSQLYRAVLQSITGKTLDLLKQHCVQGTPEERLHNLIRCILTVESGDDHWWARQLMAREIVEFRDDQAEPIIEAIRPMQEIAEDIVTDLLGKKTAPESIQFAACMVIPICVNRVPQQRLERKLYAGADFREISMEKTVEQLYQFLLAGIQSLSRKQSPKQSP